jgi:hypothetical protein
MTAIACVSHNLGQAVVTIGTSGTQAGVALGTGGFGSFSATSKISQGRAGAWIAAYSSSTRDLVIQLFATYQAVDPPLQADIRRVRIEDGAGAFQEFAGASATFSTAGTLDFGLIGQWEWGTGSSRVWQTTDSGEQHKIILIG